MHPLLPLTLVALASTSAQSCEIQQDTDYFGNDLYNAPTASADECCQKCADESECGVAVQFEGHCYLKASGGAPSKSTGRIALLSSPAPSSPWASYQGLNCYDGHGGSSIVPGDEPLPSLSLEDCEAECAADKHCEAIVRVRDEAVGDCWKRSSVTVEECEQSEGYATFVHTGTWPPSPPNPPPAPCCDGYINNFNMTDNWANVKLPSSGDVRGQSFALLIADFGLATGATSGACCQQDVADLYASRGPRIMPGRHGL